MSWFIFVQHGSHGNLCDFDSLKELIEQKLKSKQQNKTFNVKFFGSRVNEGLGTDVGTIACVDKLMPELTKELQDFATKQQNENNNNNNNKKIHFSVCSHSFGGILSREVVKRLFSSSSSATTANNNNSFSQKYKPLSFVAVASPLAGVTCIDWTLLRWGGWFLGKIYSLTYQELFLDSPLLETMATDKNYLEGFTSFNHHLFVGAHSHDYLVRFETATLLPIKTVEPTDKFPKRIANNNKPSTHVGQLISLLDEKTNKSITSSEFSQLNVCEKSQKIAKDLRSKLIESKKVLLDKNENNSLNVLPVFIPEENQYFCIAHDTLMRKGLSKTALPDVLDAVAEEMVEAFLKEQI